MKKYISIFFVFVLLLTSCNSDVIVELPEPDRKLAFYSITQEDHLWEGRLSLSEAILKPFDSRPVTNGTIKLYEDDVFIESLSFANEDPDGALYKATTAKPKAGKRYRMEVTAPPYPSLVTEYVHPQPVTIESFEFKLMGPGSYPGTNNINFKVGFTDPPGNNYYEVVIAGDTNTKPDVVEYGTYLGLTFVDPAYKNNTASYYLLPAIFDDTYFNGQSVVFEFESQVFSNPEIKRYFVYLRTISKDLYWYLKTSTLQRDTRDDPFSQPVKVENNIENGYGIFGGVTQTYRIVTIP